LPPLRRPRLAYGRRACAGSLRRGGRPSSLIRRGAARFQRCAAHRRAGPAPRVPGGEAGGILSCPRTWPARDRTHTALSQPAGEDRGRRPCVQLLQLAQRLAEQLRIVGSEASHGCFVRTAELLPAIGGSGPVTGHLEKLRVPLVIGARQGSAELSLTVRARRGSGDTARCAMHRLRGGSNRPVDGPRREGSGDDLAAGEPGRAGEDHQIRLRLPPGASQTRELVGVILARCPPERFCARGRFAGTYSPVLAGFCPRQGHPARVA
jgi:hypothetical protein